MPQFPAIDVCFSWSNVTGSYLSEILSSLEIEGALADPAYSDPVKTRQNAITIQSVFFRY